MTAQRPFLKPFLAMSGLGFLGILSLIPVTQRAAELVRGLPETTDLPTPALAVLLLVQPAILLLAGVALGVALAEKAGLSSLVILWLRGEPAQATTGGWRSTLLLTIVLASATIAADLVFRSQFPAAFAGIPSLDDVTLSERMLGLLYGGITEELVFRFGLMSFLLWAGLRLTAGRFRPFLAWISIGLSAFAFAAGHLGVIAGASADDQGVLIVRTLSLNGLLGLLFGWLYARRSLEHAMLAHAFVHVIFWTAPLLFVRLGHNLAQ
ncbi:CPBP family glutamic-type intramembrane protease [Microvirga sp. G4-2]|uniref:CPBP family glutamic-type intramembrane protease n=1 Tax=Microvirga sp. G4-2 TaxID=3434467 RepID=UPI0040444B1C